MRSKECLYKRCEAYYKLVHKCSACVYAPTCKKETEKKVRRFRKRMDTIVQQAKEQGVHIAIENDGTGINMNFVAAGAVDSARIIKFE